MSEQGAGRVIAAGICEARAQAGVSDQAARGRRCDRFRPEVDRRRRDGEMHAFGDEWTGRLHDCASKASAP
jgi:hypothetical protein